MRLLLVSPYFIDSYKNNISMGSAVKIAQNLSKSHQVKVLTTGRKVTSEQINNNLIIKSVSGILIPDPVNYMISIPILLEFIKILKTENPDLIIVSKYMFFSSFVIPIAKIMGFKVITITDTFPGINWFSTNKITSTIMWLYARIFGIPLLKISDRVVLLYPGLEDIAKRYKLNYVTIPNGIEEKYFGKLPLPKDIKRPKGEFWLGFVGRPESAKGYTVSLEIAHRLTDDSSIKIVFVGGNEKPHTEENRIYLGFRKDIMQIYQLLNICILPSHAEGLPNVVMEAMAQGTPVIGSAVGGVPYIISNLNNGIIVKSQDVEGFVKNIRLLYQNQKLRSKLGFNARKTIKAKYNWGKIIITYNNLIKNICVA